MNDSLVAVTDYVVALLKGSQDPIFRDVWYGDERHIPKTPAASVAVSTKRRDYVQTGMRTENLFSVTVTIYHSRLEAPGVTRRECDVMAEKVEKLLHTDRTMGGLLYDALVTEVAPGFSARENVVMRATRITLTGRSKTMIGV